jgi:hypothetical protein
MTFLDFVEQINLAQAKTPMGKKPRVFIVFPETLPGKFARIQFEGPGGTANIEGDILDKKYIGGKPATACAFDCEEAMKELVRVGLCGTEEPSLLHKLS